MRLHWYGLRYGDRYTTPEQVQEIRAMEARERADREAMRQRLALMSPEERAVLFEEVKRADGNADGAAGGPAGEGSAGG